MVINALKNKFGGANKADNQQPIDMNKILGEGDHQGILDDITKAKNPKDIEKLLKDHPKDLGSKVDKDFLDQLSKTDDREGINKLFQQQHGAPKNVIPFSGNSNATAANAATGAGLAGAAALAQPQASSQAKLPWQNTSAQVPVAQAPNIINPGINVLNPVPTNPIGQLYGIQIPVDMQQANKNSSQKELPPGLKHLFPRSAKEGTVDVKVNTTPGVKSVAHTPVNFTFDPSIFAKPVTADVPTFHPSNISVSLVNAGMGYFKINIPHAQVNSAGTQSQTQEEVYVPMTKHHIEKTSFSMGNVRFTLKDILESNPQITSNLELQKYLLTSDQPITNIVRTADDLRGMKHIENKKFEANPTSLETRKNLNESLGTLLTVNEKGEAPGKINFENGPVKGFSDLPDQFALLEPKDLAEAYKNKTVIDQMNKDASGKASASALKQATDSGALLFAMNNDEQVVSNRVYQLQSEIEFKLGSNNFKLPKGAVITYDDYKFLEAASKSKQDGLEFKLVKGNMSGAKELDAYVVSREGKMKAFAVPVPKDPKKPNVVFGWNNAGLFHENHDLNRQINANFRMVSISPSANKPLDIDHSKTKFDFMNIQDVLMRIDSETQSNIVDSGIQMIGGDASAESAVKNKGLFSFFGKAA